MVETVQTWGDAVLVSVTDALRNFLGFLPALVGALIVVILGWILSGFIAGLIEKGLKAVGFERASDSAGISGFIQRSGTDWTASRVVAEIVKWFIRLVAIQAAAQILGMGQITAIINSILLFLPNLIVALAIIVLGAFIAKFVAGVVRSSVAEMGFSNPDLIAAIARYGIIAFAVVAAIDQLGIAETVVNTLLIGTVGALALAVGLAFGLGGQQTAGRLTESWYASGQAAGQRIAGRRGRNGSRTRREAVSSEPGKAS
jgi:Conserved TM helix